MTATLTPDHKYLNVAVVNARGQEQNFDLSVTGVHVDGPSTLWQLTGSSLDAANHVGQPAQVAIKEISIDASAGENFGCADQRERLPVWDGSIGAKEYRSLRFRPKGEDLLRGVQRLSPDTRHLAATQFALHRRASSLTPLSGRRKTQAMWLRPAG
jgi:hypothetical protein